MPTIPSITTSVENQQALVLDLHAKKGTFKKDARGRLIRHTGGFTVVYPYNTSNGEKWAFRCWHSELGNVRARFETISKAIENSRLPYLCDFVYVDKGINVEGKIYPTTRMRWVEGQTLKNFICNNSHSQSILLELANKFLLLAKDMHNHSLAHGDLQHGNIIVGNDGKLYLVDYDSFYCPQLKGEKDIITGLKDYQHPSRKNNSYISEKIDYFSELIIYTSILGIAYSPSLVNKYQVEDSEHMLFESKDFVNIKHSEIYKDLENLNPIFSVLLNILELYLSKRTLDELEPFDVLLDRMTKAPEITSFTYSPSRDLYVGDKIKLSWCVDGSDNYFIDGKSVKQSYCERTLSKTGINSFTLKVSNDFKDARRSLEIMAFAVPEIKFSASNDTLHKNKSEKTTIEWSVNHGYKVSLCHNGVTEDVNSEGSKEFCPDSTTTYKLIVIGLDKKRIFEKEITIGVYSEASVSFIADKETVLSNKPIQLSWTVENAKKVELIGFGEVHNKGSKNVSPDKDITYILKITDPFGSKEYKLPIKTLPLPVFKIKTDKNKINKDKSEKATISWDIQNVSSVSIDLNGNFENIKNKGSRKIAFQESTSVVFKCIALDGESSFEESLPISVFNEAKVFFNSDRKYTIPEVHIELSWDVKYAKRIELKGYGEVSPTGKKQIKIQKETVFSLIVTDEFTTQEKSICVKMLPLPMVQSISVPVPQLNKPLNVTINVPKPDTQLSFPQFNLPSVNFKIPDSPNMDVIFETLSNKTRPSILSEIKSLFTHYFNK